MLCVYLEACTGADTRNDAAFYRLANAYYRRSDSRAIHLSTCAHVTDDNGCLDANVDGGRMHCYGGLVVWRMVNLRSLFRFEGR